MTTPASDDRRDGAPAAAVPANLDAYEAYTCVKTGMTYSDAGDAFIERREDGRAVFSWKRDAPPLEPGQPIPILAPVITLLFLLPLALYGLRLLRRAAREEGAEAAPDRR